MAEKNNGPTFRNIWNVSISYQQFIDEARELLDLWHGKYRTTTIPAWAKERASEARWKAVGITEDWCWDASITLPVVAKLADETGCFELRVVRRDEHPEIMDRYLTDGARSIPIVVVADKDDNELGYWGPRPRELQQWVKENRPRLSKEEFTAKVRRWYAVDKGQSTLREIMELLK